MPVEIILTQFIENLGAEADIVKVKPGYARNFLIPQGFAESANAATKAKIEHLRKARAEREARELNEAQELATKLNKITLTFQMTVGEGANRVFGSVTAQDIVQRLQEMGHNLDKKRLALAQPLKTLGEHVLNLQLGHGIQAKLKVVLDIPTQPKSAEAEKKDRKEKGVLATKGKEGKEGKLKEKESDKSKSKSPLKRNK